MQKKFSISAFRSVGAAVAASTVALGMAAAPAVAQDASKFESTTIEELQNGSLAAVPQDELPAGRFIVTFNNMTGLDKDRKMGVLDEIVKEHSSDASFVREMFDGSYVVELDPPVPAEDVPSLRGHLESKAEIHTAQVDRIQYSAAVANDEHYQYQWHLFEDNGANVEAAWDTGADATDTVIAVVDSGITRHPDLDAKVLPGVDMIQNTRMSQDGDGRDRDPQDAGDWNYPQECHPRSPGSDSSWHGTHVAGIAAAITNNNEGVAGVAPEAGILPVRALGRCGGYTSDIADGIAWAAGADIPGMPTNQNKADVINLSLGGAARQCAPAYQSAIDYANQQGSTIAVAAGNENNWTDSVQPANCNDVIVVGATGPEGHRSSYSNFGEHVDLGAPGGNMNGMNAEAGILSTVNDGARTPGAPSYSFMEGTSMATPVVAGVIALMKGENPQLSNEEIESILKDTAKDYSPEPYDAWKTAEELGAGIVDAKAAVCEAKGGDCESADSEEPTTEETTPETTEPTEEAQPSEPAEPTEPAEDEPTEAPEPTDEVEPAEPVEPEAPRPGSFWEELLSWLRD